MLGAILLSILFGFPAFAEKEVHPSRIISLFNKLKAKQVSAIRTLAYKEYTALKHLYKRPSYRVWFQSEISVIMNIKTQNEILALSEWDLVEILELDHDDYVAIRKLSDEEVETIQNEMKELTDYIKGTSEDT